ncbi:MAG: hypothetical protein IJ446_07935, partial [Oscillospiraceae bacterium]|nr:hypothetical protein [Oscillospiraceae bacterium]
ENPSEYFMSLRDENRLLPVFAELAALSGVIQSPVYHREGDAWTHTMMVLDEAAKRRDNVKNPFGFMLSALCHDYGKAVCTEEKDGAVHALRHETEGLPLVKSFCQRINADSELTEYVLNMTMLHMQPITAAKTGSARKKTNKMYDMSAEPFALIQLSVCDGLGKLPQVTDTEDFLLDRLEYFYNTMKQPYVTDDDIIGMGISCSDIRFDDVKAYAHKLRLAGTNKESALKHVSAYIRM